MQKVPNETSPTVVVGVATYRRPALLKGLLPKLVAQADELGNTRVVVVDNDPEESARDVVSALASEGVRYLPEPRPGIAAARNRAIDDAAGADVIVFFDDDEEPTPTWLRSLVEAWQEWRCAAVAGPVISTFSGEVDPWVRACPTFRPPNRKTGSERGGAGSGNLLIDLAELDRHGLRFDEAFGITGGSDTMLTHTLVHLGGVIRWCNEAVAYEPVPENRATREWVLRRETRTGNGWSRVALTLTSSRSERLRTRIDLILRGLYRMLGGLLATPARNADGGYRTARQRRVRHRYRTWSDTRRARWCRGRVRTIALARLTATTVVAVTVPRSVRSFPLRTVRPL